MNVGVSWFFFCGVGFIFFGFNVGVRTSLVFSLGLRLLEEAGTTVTDEISPIESCTRLFVIVIMVLVIKAIGRLRMIGQGIC